MLYHYYLTLLDIGLPCSSCITDGTLNRVRCETNTWIDGWIGMGLSGADRAPPAGNGDG